MTTPLSPATQAIIDASNCAGSRCVQLHIADALRAAANQMRYSDQLGLTGFGGYVQAQDQILAIAAELEGAQ